MEFVTLRSFRKVVFTGLLLTCYLPSLFASQLITVDKFKGLNKSLNEDKLEDGEHSVFSNVYIKDGNIQVIKGKAKLNSTANSNTTINGVWYYQNQAGTTKKLVVMENTVLASYDVDGTNRTQLNTGLTSEPHDGKQIGDTLYITSDTDGLYKWTGSGSATAITGVSAPSNVNFSATTGAGAMTPGLDAVVVHEVGLAGASTYRQVGSLCTENPVVVSDYTEENTACGSLSASFSKTCATSATYQYKVTEYSSVWGIEGEPSTADSATLTGADTVNVSGKDCWTKYSNSSCTTASDAQCDDTTIIISGAQTRTTGTLASAPSAPFDGYRVYRTVSGGSDYFLLGYQTTGTYTDGKSDLALGSPLDTTIDTITPPSYRYIEEYKGTIFLAQGKLLYFTRLPISVVSNADKYWLESDKIDIGTKDSITGLITTSNSLLIFTPTRILELTGFGTSSFRLKTLIEGIGAISDETVELDSQGDVIFNSGVNGVYKLKANAPDQDSLLGAMIDNSQARLTRLSSPVLDNVFRGIDTSIVLSPSDYANAHGYYATDEDLYFLYIGEVGFIYDNVNKSWTYLPGNKLSASLYTKNPNALGQGILLDNLGFMYKNWYGYTSGTIGGTTTSGVPTSSTTTTLTDSGATFYTTGGGLSGQWVVLNQSGTLQYRRISSNTTTQLTVETAWTSDPTTSDSYYIGYLIPEIKTKQFNVKPPKELRVDALSIVHNKSASSQTLYVDYYENKSSTSVGQFSFDLSSNFVDQVGTATRGKWVQFYFRTYIHSTSNSIVPPLDITNYTIRASQWEAQ